jgi:uncharacterized protein
MTQAADCQTHLMALAKDYARALRDLLGDRLVSVVLYGSVARGEAGPSSDLDLLIVMETLPVGQFARKATLRRLDSMVDERLSVLEAQGCFSGLSRLIMSKVEAERIIPLYLDMTEDAIILEDKGEFFASVLERLRGRLRQLGAVRKRMGRIRYWDLKPDLAPGERFEL